MPSMSRTSFGVIILCGLASAGPAFAVPLMAAGGGGGSAYTGDNAGGGGQAATDGQAVIGRYGSDGGTFGAGGGGHFFPI